MRKGTNRGTLDGLSPVWEGPFCGRTGCSIESVQMRQNGPENGLCHFAVIYVMPVIWFTGPCTCNENRHKHRAPHMHIVITQA